MATKTKKPLKDKGILIRVTEAQKEAFAEAATKDGRSVSSWIVSAALREIQRTESKKK